MVGGWSPLEWTAVPDLYYSHSLDPFPAPKVNTTCLPVSQTGGTDLITTHTQLPPPPPRHPSHLGPRQFRWVACALFGWSGWTPFLGGHFGQVTLCLSGNGWCHGTLVLFGECQLWVVEQFNSHCIGGGGHYCLEPQVGTPGIQTILVGEPSSLPSWQVTVGWIIICIVIEFPMVFVGGDGILEWWWQC